LRTRILDRLLLDLQERITGDPPQLVVAIPAKNEAEVLDRCLVALAEQRGIDLDAMAVIVLVNNSSDETAARAEALADQLPFRLVVVQADLPHSIAHAGTARRLVMDAAAALLRIEQVPGGVIFTTDADSRAAPDWMATTLAAMARGVDAVAGAVAVDPLDMASLTPQLRERGRRESTYEAILVEIDCLLDPIAHDPWPRHDTASGASLAVSLEAYLAVGGLPAVPLGEDRALARVLADGGWRLRHAPEVRVVTSGRLVGRAVGGAADTIRQRNEDPSAPCDERLEPLGMAIRRARWRGQLRRMFEGGAPDTAHHLADALAVDPGLVTQALHAANFQQGWSRIEAASPALVRKGLQPGELPEHILAGLALLLPLRVRAALSGYGATGPADNRPSDLAAAPA
jgi:hypothetical protein